MQHTRYEHRAEVDPVAAPDAVDRALDALLARAPNVGVERTEPAALAFRREPPWFLALAGAAMLALGLLWHGLAAHEPRRFVARALPWVMDAAGLAMGAFVTARALERAELRAGEPATFRERVLPWRVRETRFDAAEVTAALVVGRAGARRVVLVGPRNVELVTLLRERAIDPPTLARWFADVAALVVARGAAAAEPR